MTQSQSLKILIITLSAVFFNTMKGSAIEFLDGDLNLGLDAGGMIAPPDSITVPDEVRPGWKTMLMGGRLKWQDERVRYPKFIEFCLNVYRWAYRTFNTYDPEWVAPTGKSGKVRIFSDNWSDVYDFRFSDRPLVMSSQLYSNIGLQANYYVISASYSFDLNSLFHRHETKHRKWTFSLSTARLFAEAYRWENNIPDKGLSFKATGILGIYIFNNMKFSFSAPYDLSNYQRKSAGSWMAGMSGTFYNAYFDFNRLPEETLEELQFPFDKYSLDYNAVNLIGGYSYNWVWNKHFLFNATTLPGIGVSFSFSDSTTGRKDLFSASIRQMLSLTYTNRQFFITGNGMFHGNMFPNGQLAFFSGIINFQMSTGVRF